MLKVKVITYKEVAYKDLEEFILDHYGFSYDIVNDMEWHNDQKRVAEASGNWTDGYDDEEYFKKWLESRGEYGGYMLNNILTDLCIKGLIEKGVYLVDIYW